MGRFQPEGGPSSTANASQVERLTILDRSVPILLPDADDSPSRKAKVSLRLERLHKLHGTSLIFESSKLLGLNASTYATACTIFHRFYHQVSLTDMDVWSVAMSSVLLATKVEEEPQTLKAIIHAFSLLYRKRLVVISVPPEKELLLQQPNSDSTLDAWDWSHPYLQHTQVAKEWTIPEKERRLRQIPLPMKLGPVYKEWHQQACEVEAKILRQLGFTLHWIPDSHPHRFILYFCQALGLTEVSLTQRAWNYCNDSCRLDLCVRYSSEIIAATTIFLAARDFQLELPMAPQPWWETFVGKAKTDDIASVANTILGFCNLDSSDQHETKMDSYAASRGFIPSLVRKEGNGSFNDPDSFLWMQTDEIIIAENVAAYS
eukprot:Nitzschia sp. Nitz4//scaffold2_size372955//63787//65101//NITZ4_000373-RA/size372955-snap-gene-0.65-mRNA-1//-1//CDS//3329546626//1730//frame0